MANPTRREIHEAIASARTTEDVNAAFKSFSWNIAHHIHSGPACTSGQQQPDGSCSNAACGNHPGNEITCFQFTVPGVNVQLCSCWHHTGAPQPRGG